MKSIEITNIKSFTSSLFAGERFDSFCVTEASFSTLFNVTIDGHINKTFLEEPRMMQVAEESAYNVSESDLTATAGTEEDGPIEAVTWGQIRPLCYQIIKGRRLPVKFKIVLMTPPDKVEGFLKNHGLQFAPSDVNALFMNIHYEAGKLVCVTGTSLKTFSMDRSLELAWDDSVAFFVSKFE